MNGEINEVIEAKKKESYLKISIKFGFCLNNKTIANFSNIQSK